MEEKTVPIQKPLWEASFFLGAHVKSASAAHEKCREGHCHHHGHTADQGDSPTLAFGLLSFEHELLFQFDIQE